MRPPMFTPLAGSSFNVAKGQVNGLPHPLPTRDSCVEDLVGTSTFRAELSAVRIETPAATKVPKCDPCLASQKRQILRRRRLIGPPQFSAAASYTER
jgi:hypothetical protein